MEENSTKVSHGTHLVQIVGSTDLTMTVEFTGDSTLSMPELLPTGAIHWANDEIQQKILGNALSKPLMGDTIWFDSPEGIWVLECDENSWEFVMAKKPSGVVSGKLSPKIGNSLRISGAASSITGVGFMVFGYMDGVKAWQSGYIAGVNGDTAGYLTAHERYNNDTSMVLLGGLLAGGGTALSMTGIFLDSSTVFVPTGNGFSLMWEY